MGGYIPVKCETVYWRSRLVCKHSVPKLNAWAASLGSGIYCKPIQGCYSTAVSASAMTHARGGVYDVEMDGYSIAQSNFAVNKGRLALLITEGRWWVNSDGTPNHHIHLIDPACPDLHAQAAEQVEQYRRGETGLVGTADRDTWDRSTAAVILRQFDTRHNTPTAAPVAVKPRTYTIPSGGTLAKAAAVLGATVAAVAAFNGISNPNVVHPGQVVTKPPVGYSAPAVVRPTVSVPKPTVRPVPTVTKPKPSAPVTAPYRPRHAAPAPVVSRALLKPGRTNASVRSYERALAARGYLPLRYVDGYYGTLTSAATRAAYRHYRWTPWATVPGPALLQALGLKFVR